MRTKKIVHARTEVTMELSHTKELIGVVSGDTAKILCIDKARDWQFNLDQIDNYISFLEDVRGLLRDAQVVEVGNAS